MLIIFDLDDTLVDTSGCIIPKKLEDALLKMLEAGLVVHDVPKALEMIKQLNETSNSSKEALAEFLDIINADKSFLEIGSKEIYENLSADLPVDALDQAYEVLCDLRNFHQLAIVTVGIADQQINKLKKAGIDSTLFSKIIVSEGRDKGPHYKAIVDDLGFSPSDVVVCGDRIAIDLAPAKELGYKTVHMRWGRGLNGLGLKSDVDYTILHLSEIKGIITSLKSFS